MELCVNDQLLPLQWLKQIWINLVKSVITRVGKAGADMNENEVGQLSEVEAKNSLKETKGDVEEAVKISIAKRCKLVSKFILRNLHALVTITKSIHFVKKKMLENVLNSL